MLSMLETYKLLISVKEPEARTAVKLIPDFRVANQQFSAAVFYCFRPQAHNKTVINLEMFN